MTAELGTQASAAPLAVDQSLTEQVAKLVAETRATDIPGAVRETAAWWVLDWLGAAIAGLETQPGRIFVEHTLAQPVGLASCIGLADGRSAQVAALHNGGVSHIVETDDVHRTGTLHPGVVVIPAALAVAEQRGLTGRDLLAAVVLGYEVAIRVGESVGKTHYYHWHNTSTCGVYGAAAAAGWLLGQDQERLTWALGSAGTQAGGLWEFIADGAMSKHLHSGRAAANGVLAAELASFGFTGARKILEGKQGFFAATAPDGDPGAVTRDLGKGWKLTEASIKPYPSCRHTHAAIDAALFLRGEHGLSASDVDRIEIDAYQSTIDLTDNETPANPYAAKFSVQYCVARALTDGEVGLPDFAEGRIAEPEVRDLMHRSTVRLDPELDARAPRQLPSRVRFILRDGRAVEQTVLDAKGDPEAPLSHAELRAKFLGLTRGTAYEGRGAELVETVTSLDTAERVRGLLSLR